MQNVHYSDKSELNGYLLQLLCGESNYEQSIWWPGNQKNTGLMENLTTGRV